MTTKNKTPWYRVTPANAATNTRAEIYIYDVIVDYAWDDDETTAKGFIDDLKALGSDTPFDLHINSPGGSVFAGLAIYNAILRHRAEVVVYIDGLAASIASVVAMAGNRVVMPDNALLMIHDPYSFAGGTAAELRKAAEMLDKATDSIISTYKTKTGLETGALAILMAAETWINATDALEQGFIDEIEEALPMAALADKMSAFDLTRYHNVPIPGTPLLSQPTDSNLETVAGDKEGVPGIGPNLPTFNNNQPQPLTPSKGTQVMDMTTLKIDHPETYNAIFASGQEAGNSTGHETGLKEGLKLGAQAEAARIVAVEDQLIPGHETLIAELKADGQTTGPEAAVKILAAEKLLRAGQLKNLTTDTTPHVAAAQDDPDTDAEEKAAVNTMVAAMNKNRK